jgi:hypothetical protein
VLAKGGGQGPIQVGDAAEEAAQQPDLDADAAGQDLGIELVDGDRGGPQPVKQLCWGAPAAIAVAAQEGGQAALAQPLGGLRGPIALQEVQRDVAVQAGNGGLGARPVGLEQGAELVGGGGLGLQVVRAQARDGLQVQGGGIGGLPAAQPVAVGAQVLGQLEAVAGVGGGLGRAPAGSGIP